MSKKKVIILIVEGKLDRYFYREYLGDFISDTFNNGEIKYKVTSGDICTTHNYKGAINTLEGQLEAALDEHKLDIEDVLYIAHVCDTDGCYLDERDFKIDQTDSLYHDESFKYVLSNKTVYAKSLDQRDKLQVSWSIKKRNQGVLIDCERIKGVPYRIYYNSLFLEHFLTGKLPRYSDDKRDCIDAVFEEFSLYKDLEVYAKGKSLSDNYKESWNLLEDPRNKMISTTNLNIFFEDIRNLSSIRDDE